jgi:hypothetical protein
MDPSVRHGYCGSADKSILSGTLGGDKVEHLSLRRDSQTACICNNLS